jgi:hypothetical protein
MNGTINFDTLTELADFLKAFTGSTAIFEVMKSGSNRWKLVFLGGY